MEGIGKGAKPAVEGDPSSVGSAVDDIGRGRTVGGRRKGTCVRVMLQHHRKGQEGMCFVCWAWTEPVQASQSWGVLAEGRRSVVGGCVSVVMEGRGDGADNFVDGPGGDGAVWEEGGERAGGN